MTHEHAAPGILNVRTERYALQLTPLADGTASASGPPCGPSPERPRWSDSAFRAHATSATVTAVVGRIGTVRAATPIEERKVAP